jgi:hypothetical protein
LVPRFGGDADALGAGEVEHGVHSRVAASFSLACNADVVERARAGAEGFFDRVQAV